MALILIVDDQPQNRQLLTTLLGYRKHQLLEAADGYEGLRLAREHHPDLIISDIVMSAMDGYEFARQVRADATIAATPIIFNTGSLHHDEAEQLATACGVLHVIHKPAEPEEVFRAVDAALSRQPGDAISSPAKDFDEAHRQLLTNRLFRKIAELEKEIAERTAAQEALHDSEKRFRALIENSQDAIALFSADGEILYASPSSTKVVGYQPEELVGRNALEFVEPSERERIKEVLAEAIRQPGEGISTAGRVRHKNGQYRFLEGIFTNLLDDPAVGAIVNNYRDVTERQQTEEALRRSEARYGDLYENAPDMFVSVDAASGRIIQCNETTARVTGYTKDELIGKPVLEIYDPQSGSRLLELFERFKSSGQLRDEEMRIVCKDGTLRDISLSSSAVRDANGRIVSSRSVWRDVSARKKAEEAHSELSRLLEESLNEIYVFDSETVKLIHVNEGARRNLGYTMEELSALTPVDLKPEFSPESFGELIHPLQTGEKSKVVFVTKHQRKDRSLYDVEVHLQLMTFEGRAVFVAIILDISERKRAEDALRASEQRFRELLENVDLIAVLLDVDGRVTFCNDFLLQLTGYAADEVVGSDWFETFVPDQRDDVRQTFATALRTGDVIRHLENPIRTRAGELREIAWNNSVLRNADGTVIGTASIGEDITERKRAEERLNLSEKKFSDAFHTSPAGITITRITDGSFIDVNQAFLRMFEFEREEVIGRTSIDLNLLTGDEREILIAAQVESGGLRNAELSARTRSGKVVNLLFSSKPIEWEGETHHITTLIDISDRKQAEAALREAHDRLAKLVATTPGIVCSFRLKPDGSISFPYGSERLEELLGLTSGVLIADASALFGQSHPDDVQRVRETIAESARTMAPWRQEWRVRNLAGDEIWLEGHSVPLREADGSTLWHGVTTDITARKKAEAELIASAERLRALSARLQSAREEEGTRIARELHDELGGALTGFKWDLEGVGKALAASSNGDVVLSAREKISGMTQSIETTIETVRRISSELRPGVLDDLGLVAAIEWQSQQFQQRTGIKVNCRSDGDVEINRERAIAVFRIFQEILTNVLRHAQASRVNVKTHRNANQFSLEVADNGRGFSLKAHEEVRSLGLLGMRERAHLVGGSVEIKGAKGKGTMVLVSVPMV